jgi:tRNA(Ile)-lysidine synthetase-like protein
LAKTHPPITFSLLKSLQDSFAGIVEDIAAKKFVVAVSGGIDSIVLLNLMAKFLEPKNLVVAHFDHKLRGCSAKDAEFVKSEVTKLGVESEIGVAIDSPEKENLESWARERRYSFLETVREKFKADWILTAHNQNDQVETILMRVINGRIATKSFGIARIDQERRLIRPLLQVTREEIESCLKELELTHREDPTNKDLGRTRNKIRHQLMPLLTAEYNPRLLDTVGNISSRLALDESYLWEEAKALKATKEWSAEEFNKLPFPLQWRVLDCWVDKLGCDGSSHREVGFRALKLATERINQSYKDSFVLDLGACIRMNYSYKGGPKFEFYQHRKPSVETV